MKHLPALEKAVEATNIEYKQYVGEKRTEDERRADVWNDERKNCRRDGENAPV